MSDKINLPFSANIAAAELHSNLDLSESHGKVLKQFAAALQDAYDRGKEDSKPVFQFRQVDDESLEVLLNGQHVISVDHDGEGWAGISAVKNAVKTIAAILGVTVEEIGEEEDEGEVEDA